MPRFPHNRKTKEEPNEPSLYLNPYILGTALGVLSLAGVIVYHFYFSVPVVEDKTAVGGSQTVRSGFFSFFGRSVFSKAPPLELSNDEMDALGIPRESRKEFEGVTPENFREKRRLSAMQKYEGGRKVMEERHRQIAEAVQKRNDDPGSGELRNALESMQDAESLGLMKLESFVAREAGSLGTGKPPGDSLLYAYQCLTEVYAKKNMKAKAKDSYLNYLRLMKEKSPPDQGQAFDQAIAQMEGADVTSTGN